MIATMDSDEEEEIEFEEDKKVRVVNEAFVPVAVDEDGEETTRKKRRKTTCKVRRKRTVKEMGAAAWATRTTARKSRTTRTTVGYRPTKVFFFRLFLLLRPRLLQPWTGLCFRSRVGRREDEDKDE